MFGLSRDTTGYAPWERCIDRLPRHYIERLLEPELSLHEVDGALRSEFEVPGWVAAVPRRLGTSCGGVLTSLESRGPAFLPVVDRNADAAWSRLEQVPIAPRPQNPVLLAIGARTRGLGSDASWSGQPISGVIATRRGSVMRQEREIARLGWLPRPLFVLVEASYVARRAVRRLRAAKSRGTRLPRAERR